MGVVVSDIRRNGRAGAIRNTDAGAWHLPGDPMVGTALDPASYDYVGQVLFNAHAGPLWAAFTTATRRTLAATAGVTRAHAS